MTPKEKAEELYKRYSSIKIKEVYDGIFLTFADDLCKQMSLIAVDEILKALPPFEYGLEFVAKIEFWNEVKQEIEKL